MLFHAGLYQFRVMPFGLAEALGVTLTLFQQLMLIVLSGLEEFAMAYIDEILVFSKDPSEHFQYLQIVFDRLRKHGLKLKLQNCQIFKYKTNY